MSEFLTNLYKATKERLYECSKYLEEKGNLKDAKDVRDFADRLSNE
jgi:hypothetical protein